MLVFGLRATDVDAVADQLAAILSWTFEKRNSSYLGDYCLFKDAGREVQVLFNRAPEDHYFERDYPECGIVIYASLTPQEAAQFRASFTARFPDAVLISESSLG